MHPVTVWGNSASSSEGIFPIHHSLGKFLRIDFRVKRIKKAVLYIQYLHDPLCPNLIEHWEPYGEVNNQISHGVIFDMFSPLNIFDEESYLSPLIISNHIGTHQQHWHYWQAPAASSLFQLFPEHTQKLKHKNKLGMSVCQCKFMIPDDAQKPHWLSKPFLLYLSDSFQKPTHDQGLTVELWRGEQKRTKQRSVGGLQFKLLTGFISTWPWTWTWCWWCRCWKFQCLCCGEPNFEVRP